ncbi:unnamed protein product [Nippostrongylus brasiliensis]|uniref:Probable serine/threonine-protein kinase zyg-1 (inferred by orthology to a C. elegans protein) n=1 Tax=Nippostrongylus brasiliensis TaxID=27835 RepID=A0A0N4XIG4_NIPBR|nr:unnamed protein product [Nippostrongylus brasiliensis]
MRHPNIVQVLLSIYLEDFIDGNDTYVVMELCALGSMRSYVKRNGPLSDRAAAYVLRQIISAVKYMHREGVLHRDLSTGNVLISRIFSPEKIAVKLCDFGLATHLRKGETACTVVGTPGYIAPQVFKQEYDQSADVYSMGGILYTMLTGSDPPSKGSMRFDGLGISAVELIEKMMEQDASKRIALNDIQQSNFMIDHCDNASVSRDWSAMGDRGYSARSRERRHSRDHSREWCSGFERARENARSEQSRLRRASSNPPNTDGRHRVGMGGGDSGLGSRSGGEYIIVDDNLLVFEVANKNGLITKIITVSIDSHSRQEIVFGRPLQANISRPLERDPLLQTDKSYDAPPLSRYFYIDAVICF